MRDLFRPFYPLTDTEKEKAWQEGIVVFDTSALLNLYRYPLAARDRLLAVLEGLKDRLWLPYQAALEYQRNQPTVRLEQTTRFREVREEVGALKAEFKNRIDKLQLKKRHALISADSLLLKVNGAIDEFMTELNQLEREQDERYQEGTLQLKIESLFGGRIGPAPTRVFLDAIYKEGPKRYEQRIPPGYLDAHKGEGSKDSAVFSFGGLIFDRRFGDLILWREILHKAQEDKMEWFIFVIDDGKDDWWQSVGGQKVGPRLELMDEAMRMGGVKGFMLVTSERFTEQAATLLGMEVSDDVIQQISTAKKVDSLQASIEEEPGFLEKIEESQIGLEELTQVSEGLTLELNRIQGIMSDSTRKLSAAHDVRARTAITNATAAQINSAALVFQERVHDFESSLGRMVPGIQFIMDRLDQLQSEGVEVPDIRQNLMSLFATILDTVRSAKEYDDILAGIPDATTALRRAIRVLRDGVQHYIRVASQVQRWLGDWGKGPSGPVPS